MVVTETWLKKNSETEDILRELSGGAHLELIRKDRAGRRGGGVAVIFDNRKARLTKYHIPGATQEIVCAVGKLTGTTKKTVVIAVYLPPNQTKKVTQDIIGVLADGVLKIKTELEDPYIIIAGDLNNRDLSSAFSEYVDIKLLPWICLLYTSPSPRDLSTSRMPSSA